MVSNGKSRELGTKGTVHPNCAPDLLRLSEAVAAVFRYPYANTCVTQLELGHTLMFPTAGTSGCARFPVRQRLA